MRQREGISKGFNLVGTLDVDALYPSIRLDLAVEALTDALTVTAFSDDFIEMIIKLMKMCVENSAVHYRGKWFKLFVGIPTGGPESGSIANLLVFYVVEKILLTSPTVHPLNMLQSRKRFLDDLFFGWTGTARQFSRFKSALNEVGVKFGITFKGDVGKNVDFLDCTVMLQPGGIISTKMYVKPTDATRYLNRRSDHSPHTFSSIPFSQFRRAVVLCSDEVETRSCMDYINNKLVNSGFKNEEIQNAREKAMKLNRSEILEDKRESRKTDDTTNKKLTFLIYRNDFMLKNIKQVVKECQPDINRLLGKTKIVIAERRNGNIGSHVFAKSSFSRNNVELKGNQKCNGKGCKTCDVMNLSRTLTVWKQNDLYRKNLKLDYHCDCSTTCVIYIYMCNLCKENESFYIGQTVNSCKMRANGHRACFTETLYKKSALSYHIYKDHPQYFSKKLSNYSVGIIKSTSGAGLDRAEDYYVDSLKADLSLNRYKVTS